MTTMAAAADVETVKSEEKPAWARAFASQTAPGRRWSGTVRSVPRCRPRG